MDRTNSKIGTPIARGRSPSVLRDLIVKRKKVGAETPVGHLLSNLVEQIQNLQRENDPIARANLERSMAWQMKLLAKH